MARRRRHKQRDNNSITSGTLLHKLAVPLPSLLPDLRLLEDRREFYPERRRPARGLFSDSADVVVATPRRRSDMSVPFRLAFRRAPEVAICVRRKQRREVMFAYNRTGKGSRSFRRRRNEYSDVRC